MYLELRKIRYLNLCCLNWTHLTSYTGFPWGLSGKEYTCNAGDLGSIPGLGRSPGRGNGNPLQYSHLGNSMDRRVWWAVVHWVTKCQIQPSDWTTSYRQICRIPVIYSMEGEGNGTPLQYSCLGNPMDGGAWWATVHGVAKIRHDFTFTFTFMHWRRKWQPTPVFLPEESQERGSLVGCRVMGSHRVRHDWSDLAAAAATAWRRIYQ